jgi:glycosyltransferase involved in cell wall biosynthesis
VIKLPSILEAFGQVAIEAAACGTPTIGFKETGLEDAILHNKTGYLCEHLDQKDFDQGLNWIIEKIEKNKDYFKIPCISFVKDNFSPEIVSKKYLDVYERVLNEEL